MMERVWVVGEVLVDLIPSKAGDSVIGGIRYTPTIGGGPANTARALAKWGVPISFIGGFSSDRFGHIAWSEMTREGVDLELSLESDLPTAKAIISFNENGVASYRFEIESTATFDFRQDWLPDENPSVIHIGSLATMVEPGSSALFQWLQALRGSTKPPTILFDPNVRPTFLNDVDRYRAAVENWISVADIVKASEDDLEFIYPKEDIEKVRQRWLMAGPSHLVITRGANGILGFTSNESVEVSGYEVDVIDTVGAGDTVGAIVMSTIAESGIDSLRGERFREVLDMAARVASITCSRQGANPPTRNDYEKAWGS